MKKTFITSLLNITSRRARHTLATRTGLIISVVVLAIIGYLTYSYIRSNRTIKIGDTVITKQDIASYQASIEQYKSENPNLNFGGEDREIAEHDLVLNAALKKEAQEKNIDIDEEAIESDIARRLGLPSIDINSLKTASSGQITIVRVENEYYKAKLKDVLLKKKDLLMANIWYSTEYHRKQSDPEKIKSIHQEAIDQLNKTFLPAMREGKSVEEVAQLADNHIDGVDVVFGIDSSDVYAERNVSTLVEYNGYVSGESTFNDVESTSINGVEVANLIDTDAKIAELKQPGDTTDVFASMSGSFMVIRLEETNDGAYESWDDFLKVYIDQYVAGAQITNELNRYVSVLAQETMVTLTTPGLQKAEAQASGCSDHNISFVVRSYDLSTMGQISGTTVSHYRKAHNCGSQFTGTRTVTSPATIADNCDGPPPTWALLGHPDSADWTPKNNSSGTNVRTVIGFFQSYDGFPVWTSAGAFSINQHKTWYIDADYEPVKKPDVTVQGAVYDLDTGKGVNGHTIGTCVNGVKPKTDKNGNFSFKIPAGTNFCIRDESTISGKKGPYIRPFYEGYGRPPSCNGYGYVAKTTLPDYCGYTSYEHQVSGADKYTGCLNAAPCQYDRAGDNGYDIVFQGGGAKDVCPNITGTQQTVPDGHHINAKGDCVKDVVDTGDTCPSLPDNKVTISWSTSNGVPTPNDGPPAYGASGDQYIRYDAEGTSKVTGTSDESIGGDKVPPPLLEDNGNGSALVDYGVYVDNYPHDKNQGSVQYLNYYTETKFTANGDKVYDEYDTYNGDSNGNGEADFPDEYTHHKIYLGRAYTQTNQKKGKETKIQTEKGIVMDPCYDRQFDMGFDSDTPKFSNIQWDSNEEVTQLSIGSEVRTQYSPDPLAKSVKLRQPNLVKDVPVIVTVTVYHSDGRAPDVNSLTKDATCSNVFTDTPFDTTSSLSFNTVTNGSEDCRHAEIPPLTAGDYACAKITFPWTKGTMDDTGKVQDKDIEQSIPDPEGDQVGEDGCTQYIVDRPYFTVYGGDVSVGSPFSSAAGACPISGSNISAWNRAEAGYQKAKYPDVYNSATYGGSGTSLAAYAVGAIQSLSTATLRSSAPTPLNGLTFSNLVSNGVWDTANYGCLPDYRAEATGGAPANDISSLDGSYSTTGTHTITTSTVGNGQRIAIFADTVVINGNITTNKDGYTSLEDIPSVRIIAQNIYIHPDVTNVDATLIAQDGNIYTCSNGGAGAPSDDSIANANFNSPNNSCKDQNLTIRGSLIGTTVNLTRGKGSIRNSNTANDYNFSGAAPNVAERIIYSPAIWLTNFETKIQEEAPYDAYTYLNPIL